MSEPMDFTALSVEPADMHTVPNHRASANGDNWEPPPAERRTRPGIFGRASTKEPPRARANARTQKAVPPNKPGQYVEPLTELYLGIAMVLMPFKPSVAMCVMSPSHAPTPDVPEPPTVAQNCAEAWDKAAQRSPAIRRFLDSALTASVAGTLIAAHMPIAIALLSDTPAFQQRFNPQPEDAEDVRT